MSTRDRRWTHNRPASIKSFNSVQQQEDSNVSVNYMYTIDIDTTMLVSSLFRSALQVNHELYLDITNILVFLAQICYIGVFDLTNKFIQFPATSLNRYSSVLFIFTCTSNFGFQLSLWRTRGWGGDGSPSPLFWRDLFYDAETFEMPIVCARFFTLPWQPHNDTYKLTLTSSLH